MRLLTRVLHDVVVCCAVLAVLGCAQRPPQPPQPPQPSRTLQARSLPEPTAATAIQSGGGSQRGVPHERAHGQAASLPNPGTRPPVSALDGELRSPWSAPFSGQGPFVFEQAGSDGRWLSLCQARDDTNGDGRLSFSIDARGEAHGDELRRYWIEADEEREIDALLGADPSGRFALMIREASVILWDNWTKRSVDLSALGADARLSAESSAALRTFSFDTSSEHLLYVRKGDSGKRLIVRDLLNGSEREFDPGPGLIWRARLDPGGAYIMVEMLTQDSNRNGRIDLPAPLLDQPYPCTSRSSFHVWTGRGDRPETVLIPLAGGAPIHDPGLIMPIRDALLRRDETGALSLSRAGKTQLLAPATCKGRIVHADARRELFIVGCAPMKNSNKGHHGEAGHVSLELVTSRTRKALNLELASSELDRELGDSPRLLPLYPGTETVLFDADRQETITLRPGDTVLATRAARALIRRGRNVLFYDADSRTEQILPLTIELFPKQLQNLPFVFISPLLINLDSASIVGVTSQRPLALSSAGQLLVSDTDADNSNVARGPLQWITPSL